VAKIVGASKTVARALAVAALSTARVLSGVVSTGLAYNFSRATEALLRKMESEAELTAADARLKIAKAIDIENRAAINRRESVARIRAQMLLAQASAIKTDAEAEFVRAQADLTTMTASVLRDSHGLTEEMARQELVEALATIQSKGGVVAFDIGSLNRSAGVLHESAEQASSLQIASASLSAEQAENRVASDSQQGLSGREMGALEARFPREAKRVALKRFQQKGKSQKILNSLIPPKRRK
jgi:hypothetical protein